MILSPYKTVLEDLQIAKAAGFTVEFYFKNDKIYDRETRKSYDNTQCVLVKYCRHDEAKVCFKSSYGMRAEQELMDFAMRLKKQ